jgi:hypothetical protein
VEVQGIPDKSAAPTVFMNYQATYTVTNPDPAAGTPWFIAGQLVPHPIAFLSTVATCGAVSALQSHLNSQIVGGTHHEKYAAFKGIAERWRLAYMSVTIYQDAPALANQGTVVCAQHAVEPAFYSATQLINLPGPIPRAIGYPHVAFLKENDFPLYETLQSMPNAYFNRSTEGAYIPLKLTKTCQHWHGEEDEMTFGRLTYANERLGCVLYPNAQLLDVAPFYGAEGFWIDPAAENAGGVVTSNFCNDAWATFGFRNLAPTTSLSFFVRAGYELMVRPGTQLTSHQVLSPKHDPVALASYFAISRELKDGYPADFNTTGKILSTISSIAKSAAPFLSLVPGIGAGLGPAAMGVGALTGGLSRLVDGGSRRDRSISSGSAGRVDSLADIVRAREDRMRRPVLSNLLSQALAAPKKATKKKRRQQQVRRK